MTATAPAHEPLTEALLDAALYSSDPFPHYERLRREAPVAWNAEKGFWSVATYDEVMEASTEPDRFCSGRGILLMEIGVEYPTPPTMMHTDPPAHTAYRKLVAPAFRPSRIAALEDTVRERVRALLEPVTAGEPIDFVPAVSVPFPLRIIGDLLGLPDADWETFFYWSEVMIPGNLELSPEEREAVQQEMRAYFLSVIAERRAEPRDDLISTLTEVRIADEQLSDDELHMFLNQLLVAGNETTRNLISDGLVALSERPEQWARLVDDRSLVPTAVEELLRWTTPVISFMRTATVDTTLGNQDIRGDDPVLLLYASANRDEKQFGPTAGELDVGRSPNHHVAFGFGAHYCIGAALARLEVRVLFEELLDRFSSLEPAGPVVRSPSDVIAGVKAAPLVFA